MFPDLGQGPRGTGHAPAHDPLLSDLEAAVGIPAARSDDQHRQPPGRDPLPAPDGRRKVERAAVKAMPPMRFGWAVVSTWPPRAPANLGAAGRGLWRTMVGAYELDPAEVVILSAACRQADDVAALEEIIDGGMIVAGSQGQPRLAAAVTEARQGRLAFRRSSSASCGSPRRVCRSVRRRRRAERRWRPMPVGAGFVTVRSGSVARRIIVEETEPEELEVPAELVACVVEDWIDPVHDHPDRWEPWRRGDIHDLEALVLALTIRARRRHRDAVNAWAAGHDLERSELAGVGIRSGRPSRGATSPHSWPSSARVTFRGAPAMPDHMFRDPRCTCPSLRELAQSGLTGGVELPGSCRFHDPAGADRHDRAEEVAAAEAERDVQRRRLELVRRRPRRRPGRRRPVRRRPRPAHRPHGAPAQRQRRRVRPTHGPTRCSIHDPRQQQRRRRTSRRRLTHPERTPTMLTIEGTPVMNDTAAELERCGIEIPEALAEAIAALDTAKAYGMGSTASVTAADSCSPEEVPEIIEGLIRAHRARELGPILSELIGRLERRVRSEARAALEMAVDAGAEPWRAAAAAFAEAGPDDEAAEDAALRLTALCRIRSLAASKGVAADADIDRALDVPTRYVKCETRAAAYTVGELLAEHFPEERHRWAAILEIDGVQGLVWPTIAQQQRQVDRLAREEPNQPKVEQVIENGFRAYRPVVG